MLGRRRDVQYLIVTQTSHIALQLITQLTVNVRPILESGLYIVRLTLCHVVAFQPLQQFAGSALPFLLLKEIRVCCYELDQVRQQQPRIQRDGAPFVDALPELEHESFVVR